MSVRRLITTVAATGLLAGAALMAGTTSAMASTAAVNLTASGSGANEVPAGSGEEGASVTGSFQLTPAGALTYTVSVSGNGEDVSAGHIHRGATGVNGDVVVPLDTAAINAGTSATMQIEAALAAEIIANPGGFYLNIHSASFAPPSGVARAQLAGGSANAPAVINTGTGGQAAAGSDSLGTAGIIGSAAALVAVGALLLARRRADSVS